MDQTEVRKLSAYVRRSCKDKELAAAISVGLHSQGLLKARATNKGILLVGPFGGATTHFTNSDRRATKNFISALRKAGLYPMTR